MTSLAALRAGAGLVTAAVPAPALARGVSVCAGVDDVAAGGERGGRDLQQENLAPEQFAALIAGKTVLAIGPGLGQAPETAKFADAVAVGDEDAGRDRRGCV